MKRISSLLAGLSLSAGLLVSDSPQNQTTTNQTDPPKKDLSTVILSTEIAALPANSFVDLTDIFQQPIINFPYQLSLDPYELSSETFGFDPDLVLGLTEIGLDQRQVYLFSLFELEPEEVTYFQDTSKPNAVLIFPYSDWNHSFESPKTRELVQEIRKVYDLWVRVAEQEGTVYQALAEISNIELLMLSGHGTATSLSLGENDLINFVSERDETYQIDLADEEIEEYLAQLHPSATIFLNSCYNGLGGEDLENLANFFYTRSLGRKVISGTDSFSSEEIVLKSVYPFEADIISSTGDDLTYQKL